MKRLIKKISALISGKTVAILGFGLEGQSTYRFLRKHFGGIPLIIADRNEDAQRRTGLDETDLTTEVFTGEGYLDRINQVDVIFKSPGVKIPEHFAAKNPDIRILTQTNLVLEGFQRQITGITGTKGKSTTSSLVHHIFLTSDKETMLIGNIGEPPFDHLHRITPQTSIVFELSSQQLEDVTVSPHIALLLNLFPEHLDRYGTKEEYFRSKWNIFQHQEKEDYLILCDEIPAHHLPGKKFLTKAKILTYGIQPVNGEGAYYQEDNILSNIDGREVLCCKLDDNLHLKGQHNRLNILATILAGAISGIPYNDILKGIKTFKGLEHRLEYVGRYRGIDFYNDSIATIPEATLEAVKTIPNIGTIILGGHDRNLDYSSMVEALMERYIPNLIFMGPAGNRMYEIALKNSNHTRHKLYKVSSFEEAFAIIWRETPAGKACLLSPAASSYDSFVNFEERGRLFKQIARSG
jgi:UDP-N-acetylmuramoylalanine--D-glutamate ligase